ncbi:MAG: single-stranded-DNA-specific exonuclease RecJ [Alphaproteobacteria bacterium]
MKSREKTFKKTVLGNRVIIKPVCEASSLFIQQNYNLPEVICRLLTSRGFSVANNNLQDLPNFLDPKIKNLLPEPFLLKDMERGVKRMAEAIIKNQKILLFADYDVDGATSCSLAYNYLSKIGFKNVVFHIPDRLSEGYGPNLDTFKNHVKNGVELIVTLDCGTSANEVIDHFSTSKIDIIVIDHHLSFLELPKAHSIINPNRLDEDGKLSNLAACGVTFLFLVALNRHLREIGFFKKTKEPNLMEMLDLVALGTVCDVMQLDLLNRAYLMAGLSNFSKHNKGLQQLIKVSGVDKKISSYHLGFILGPRINAGGRIGDASLGTQLLTREDGVEELAQTLNQLNIQRQEIEKIALQEAREMASAVSKNNYTIVLYSENWHQGVIGILASKLKEEFNLPIFIGTKKDDVIKFSGRSIEGIDIGALINEAYLKGLIITGGGHKMAGGLSINIKYIDEFINLMNEQISKRFSEDVFEKRIHIDASLSLNAINNELVERLTALEPFGQGNPEPRFLIKNSLIKKPKLVKEKHVSCLLYNGLSSEVENSTKFTRAIAFNVADNELGRFMQNVEGGEYSLIGKISENNHSNDVQIRIEDAVLN